MSIDYYACEVCGDAFPDVVDYGHCAGCEETLCADCRDEMGEKYGVLGEDHEQASNFGEDAPVCCDECTKDKLNLDDFVEFLVDKLNMSRVDLEEEFKKTL